MDQAPGFRELTYGRRRPAAERYLCTVASLPFPGVILSDTDLSTGPGGPGPLGVITCKPLGPVDGGRAVRLALKLGEIALELFP